MSYKLLENGILRLKDNAFIPPNTENGAYQDYLKWVAEGNTPQPKDVVIKPTPQQAMIAQLNTDFIMRSLLKVLAAKFGMTVQALKDEIVNATNGGQP